MKKPIYKKWWFWLIVILIIGGVSSQLNKPKKVGETGETTKTDKSSDSKEDKGPQIFKVGDIVELKDFKVTVNGIRTATQDKTGFLKADEGKEYFLVDCTVENISEKEQAVSSVIMFKIVDKDGMSYNQALFTDANGQLDGTVAPTRKIRGEYCVQVPQGKTGLELEFNSSFIGSQQIIVELN